MRVRKFLFRNAIKIEHIILFLLFVTFVSLGSAFVFLKNDIFPILCSLTLLATFFVRDGKYRIFSLIIAIPFSKIMVVHSIQIGSLFTWILLFYFILVFYERMTNKIFLNFKEKKLFLVYLLFSLFLFIVNIINFNINNILKFMSYFLYLSLPFLFFIDSKANKNINGIILMFAISHLLANLYSFTFIYLTPFGKKFTEAYIPAYTIYLEKGNFSSFRFPGLKGDSNHNSLYILFSSSLIILNINNFKKIEKIIGVSCMCLLQPFGFIGGSKSYLLILTLCILIIVIAKIRYSKKLLPYLSMFLICFVFFLFICLNFESLSKTIIRLLYIDDRKGMLNSLTTGRINLWIGFISEALKNPFLLLIGHGTNSNEIIGIMNYHNAYVQMLWEFGIIGSLLYILYLACFIKPKERNLMCYLPLIILLSFGFSLHIVYDEGIYAGIYAFLLFNTRTQTQKRKINLNLEQKKLLCVEREYNEVEI